MVHYLETKEKYKDCILFYRLGDFYEMFFEDAKTVSSELELVLTGKDCGLEERAPMCGVPFHAADSYIARLVKKGYKVAIAEQLEDPKTAKGLVKRDVIKVVTPGTITDGTQLDERRNNYLVCVVYVCDTYGISAIDISTGDFFTSQAADVRELYDEINHYSPSELICNDELLISEADINSLKNRYHFVLSAMPKHYFDEKEDRQLLSSHFGKSIEELGLEGSFAAVISAGAALKYAYDTQFSSVSYITSISCRSLGSCMVIDSQTMRNLELLETLRDKERRGSLLWVLDRTRTAMGGRLMRTVISEPLISKKEIVRRQKAVGELNDRFIDREEMIEYMKPVYDLERLLSRISAGRADPHDLLAFKSSIEMIPHIRLVLSSFESELLKELLDGLDELRELFEMLDAAIDEDAPVSQRDGGIIKDNYDAEVDRLRELRNNGKDLVLQMEERERERSGIKNLRIKFNKIFGYSIEIGNAFKDSAPADYIRKQTLTTCERYTTAELQKLADDILGADDRLKTLEYDIFSGIREKISAEADRIHKLSKSLAMLDVLCSFSVVALRNRYVCPKITENGALNIKDGRHPVVEMMLGDDAFVSNDTYLNDSTDRVNIITGPNMAGKSTYMRQVALIVLMAQIGSFVPCRSADIPICDRIFTRVGASDDLASGQSTFMVEMNEVANILRNATRKSLLILDEIGRGTSTFDGLSIAWAVVEYVSSRNRIGAKTLFATHYHELTELEGKIDGVHNYCIAVKENDGDLIFLRKIVPGGADKSYGIAVARLAGVPEQVTERAYQISQMLTDADIAAGHVSAHADSSVFDEDGLFSKKEAESAETVSKEEKKIIEELKAMNIERLTPIEALLYINGLKERLK